jgi:hypothetical protein
MSVKKIYKSTAIGATIILIIIGVIIVLSYLFPGIFLIRTDEISLSYNVKLSDFPPWFLNIIYSDQQNKSSDNSLKNPCSVSSLFISLDPVQNIQTGDQIMVTGVTNVESNSIITLKIIPVITENPGELIPKTTFRSFLGIAGSTRVLSGNGIIHRWSWVANSSELSPNLYEVTASTRSNCSNPDLIPMVDISGTSRFTLIQKSI